MPHQLVALIDRKLQAALHEVDEKAESEILHAWDTVGPQPTCPFVNELMGSIQSACVAGLNEREERALNVIQETIAPVRSRLTSRMVDELMPVVGRHFPEDKYVALVEKTPGLYQSRQASFKFQAGTFQILYSALRAQAANRSGESVRRIRLHLDEQLLQLKLSRHPWWKALWTGTQPAFKWAFGIAAAVVTAAALTYLKLK
jgi:hypothetical protein